MLQSTREAGATLSLQIVPFGVEEKLLMSRDITELEAVARMRRDFIANVSHELKTPLTVHQRVSSRRSRTWTSTSGSASASSQLMQDQAQSMQRLVADLLTLSALESEPDHACTTSEFAIVPLLLGSCRATRKALSAGRHEIDARHRRSGDRARQTATSSPARSATS